MGITRGADWGAQVILPNNVPTADTDRAAALVFQQNRSRADPPRVLLTGGDLFRTLGGRKSVPEPGDSVTEVLCDVGRVLVDGKLHYFAGHCWLGGGWFTDTPTVYCNAAYLGNWNLAPRAHPGDGLLDAVVSSLGWRQRLLSRRRLHNGSHVPHPSISTRRTAAAHLSAQRLRVRLDGVQLTPATDVVIGIEAQALTVYV